MTSKKVMPKKEVIIHEQKYGYGDLFNDCETFDDMIDCITRLKQKFLEYRILHRCDVSIIFDTYYLKPKASRMETDDEYRDRLEKNAEAAERRAKSRAEAAKIKETEDLELYKKLKKKFAKLEV